MVWESNTDFSELTTLNSFFFVNYMFNYKTKLIKKKSWTTTQIEVSKYYFSLKEKHKVLDKIVDFRSRTFYSI